MYLRTIDRQLRNVFNENSPRWEIADTYDHTRGMPQPGKNGGVRGRNDSYRTFPRSNRYNPMGGPTCAGGEEAKKEEDNGGYFDEDRLILITKRPSANPSKLRRK